MPGDSSGPMTRRFARMMRPAWIRRRLDIAAKSFERFGPVAPLVFPATGTIRVVAPHPDDESLGPGGLIALARKNGLPVTVDLLTPGTQGNPALRAQSLSKNDRQKIEKNMENVRSQEMAAAVAVLNADCQSYAGPDGALASQVDRIASDLAKAWAAAPPAMIVLPFVTDRHRDHAAAARIVAAALALMGQGVAPRIVCYETWSPCPANRALPIDDVADVKWSALLCHASQIESTDYVAAAQALARYRAITFRTGGEFAEAYCELDRPAFLQLVAEVTP